jgi:lipid-binding SYLF domain-containing protein
MTGTLDDGRRQSLPAAVRPFVNNPFTFTLESAIRNATYMLRQQDDPLIIPDQRIPLGLLHKAEGLVFLTFLRVGFFGGARMGSGLAVMKREDGTWSAPCAIGMAGAFLGVTFGADIVNMSLVLTSKEACRGLLSEGKLSFEGELGACVSLGPLGRNASVGAVGPKRVAPVCTYSHSEGLLVGADVTGSVLTTRPNVNHRFYGVQHTPREILDNVPQPDAAYILYEAILRLTDTRAYQKAKKEHQEKVGDVISNAQYETNEVGAA